MLSRSDILRGALLLTAVVGGVTSLALLRDSPVDRPLVSSAAAVVDDATVEAPAEAAQADTQSGSWSLRSGGWYIRVDGVAAEPPTFAEPTVHRPPVSLTAAISPFDQLIVHHARAEGFDWRLIAALIFEESHFNPTSESDKGAYGLMQVRPVAAHAVGAEQFREPDDNLSAGVRYLRHLGKIFRAAKDADRMGLVLAAYNMGPGHVQDAQMLARRFGFDPNRWEGHMERILPLLELPSIYERLPNGFAKGRDTVAYVQRTIERYHHYQRQSPDAPAADAEALPFSDDDAPDNG